MINCYVNFSRSKVSWKPGMGVGGELPLRLCSLPLLSRARGWDTTPPDKVRQNGHILRARNDLQLLQDDCRVWPSADQERGCSQAERGEINASQCITTGKWCRPMTYAVGPERRLLDLKVKIS